MDDLAAVLGAWREAWARRRGFVPVYLILRLASLALLAPAMGLVINLGVALSAQSALTDQEIARFLLSPLGFGAGLAVVAVLLVAEVLGFAVMTGVLLSGQARFWPALGDGLGRVLGRAGALLVFAGLLVLRILALALPFVLAGLALAAWQLGDYDINYYLTRQPPEFLWTVAAGVALLLAMAAVIVPRVSGWALALHLVVFERVAPGAAFAASAARMEGRTLRLKWRLALWLALRLGLGAALAGLAGLVLNLIPLQPGAGLRTALALTLAVAGVWMLAGLVLSATALGALVCLLAALYDRPPANDAAAGAAPPPVPPRRLRAGLTLAGLALALMLAGGLWAGARLMALVQPRGDVAIIGHRGAAGSRPENTMAAVEQALAEGADWVEIDVQETADGEIAVFHDSDFMKLAGRDLKIWDATAADLAEIDIGSWFGPDYADARAPLLRDVLAVVKGRAGLLIELKYYGHDVDLENRVIALVEAAGMADQVAVMSLKYPAVQKMRALRPGWRSGVLAATAVGDLAGLDADFIAVNTALASRARIAAVQAAGKDFYVWTVNDPLAMSRMISKGVDGLITDEPALARKVLEIRAGLSTPERLALALAQILGLDMAGAEARDDSP